MKKFLILVPVILIIVLYSNSVFAAQINTSVNNDNLLISLINNNESVIKAVKIKYIDDIKYIPIRELVTAFNGEISWDNQSKSIIISYKDNKLLLKNNSFEVFINGNKIIYTSKVIIIEGVSYAPLEFYKVFTNEYLENIEIKEVTEIKDEFKVINGINCDKIIFKGTFEVIGSFLLENPNRLVIDMKNYDSLININKGETFTKVRISKKDKDIGRYVLDLNDIYKYTIYQEENSVVFIISKNGKYTDEKIPFELIDNKIKINIKDYSNYRVQRLSNPFKVIIDIPNNIIKNSYEKISKNEIISKVQALPFEGGTRIIIYTKEQNRFELKKNLNDLSILIYEPKIIGVNYYNFGDRKYIEIKNISLANKSDASIKYFKEKIINNGFRYEITFKDNYKIKTGEIYVNDNYIRSIYVHRKGEYITISINAKKQFIYYINSETKNTNINILPKVNNKVVVIDPGHGGFDPGAINGDIEEADLNLDIALNLEKQLEEKGIKTFLMRKSDVYVGVYERADIANLLNATLFISIHINALDDRDFDGIMTLAYPGNINNKTPNGKLLAKFVQNELIISTEAKDLGIIDRDKLVVLRDTSMPSVLVECGFITNEREVSNLKEPNYQNKIAFGIKEGVLKFLEYIRW